jgi:uroporphyrinogen-III synthase
MTWAAPDAATFDTILLTSANAVRFGGEQLAKYFHMQTYAVGEATALAARAAGFADVIVGTTDAADVIAIMADAGCKNVLHLAGRDRTEIAEPAFKMEAITVYASEVLAAPDIPETAVALLHSTRAALRFASVAPNKSAIGIVAISRAVAQAAGSGWQSIAVALQPQDAAMLALAASLCETALE